MVCPGGEDEKTRHMHPCPSMSEPSILNAPHIACVGRTQARDTSRARSSSSRGQRSIIRRALPPHEGSHVTACASRALIAHQLSTFRTSVPSSPEHVRRGFASVRPRPRTLVRDRRALGRAAGAKSRFAPQGPRPDPPSGRRTSGCTGEVAHRPSICGCAGVALLVAHRRGRQHSEIDTTSVTARFACSCLHANHIWRTATMGVEELHARRLNVTESISWRRRRTRRAGAWPGGVWWTRRRSQRVGGCGTGGRCGGSRCR